MQTKHRKGKWNWTTAIVTMNHFRINGLRIKIKRDRAFHDSRWGMWRGEGQKTQNLITWILNTCRFRQRRSTDSSENTDPKYRTPIKWIMSYFLDILFLHHHVTDVIRKKMWERVSYFTFCRIQEFCKILILI